LVEQSKSGVVVVMTRKMRRTTRMKEIKRVIELMMILPMKIWNSKANQKINHCLKRKIDLVQIAKILLAMKDYWNEIK